MLSIQKSINFSGTSSIEVNGESKPFAYFNANQDLFETDRKAFEDEVRKLAN